MRMSTTTEVIAHHWAFAVFLIGAIGLCGLMLLGAFLWVGELGRVPKTSPMSLVLTR